MVKKSYVIGLLLVFVIGGSVVGCSKSTEPQSSPTVTSAPVVPVANYKWGEVINFGGKGNSNQYVKSGFSVSEKDFTWTNGKNASLSIPINKTSSDVEMKVALIPFTVKGKLDVQIVNIIVNDRNLGQWKFENSVGVEKTLIIPKDILGNSIIKLNLELPNAASPKKLQGSDDKRNLGIAIMNLTLNEKNGGL